MVSAYVYRVRHYASIPQECWCQETVNQAAVCLTIPFPGSHPLKVQTSRFFNCLLTLLKLKCPNHALRPEPQIYLFTCPSLTQWLALSYTVGQTTLLWNCSLDFNCLSIKVTTELAIYSSLDCKLLGKCLWHFYND